MDTSTLLQTLQTFQLFLQTNTIGVVLYVPLLFIAVDLVTGIIAAVKQGIFNWKKLADFWGKSLLIYVLALLLMLFCFLLNLPQIAIAISSAIGMGSFVASTLASIIENLKELGVSPILLAEVEHVGEQLAKPLYTSQAPVVPPVVSLYSAPPPIPIPIEVQKASTPVPLTMQQTADIPIVTVPSPPVVEQPTGVIIMPTGL